MQDLGAASMTWQALHLSAPVGTIRLVLADVDGVVTGGEGQPADLAVLDRLAGINRASLSDPTVPALTLCTGRPAPYVEVMAQLIGGFLPCIFEHGAGLFDPVAFEYLFHPALGDDYAARLAALRRALEEPLLRPAQAFVQPGKEASMTLYPLAGTSLGQLAETAGRAVFALGDHFTVAQGINGVELRPRGIDKGVGARWLTDRIGLALQALAGVGDAETDLSFLELVGYPAAPANAIPAVRAAARYVAAADNGTGLLEILDHLVRLNRTLVAARRAPAVADAGSQAASGG